MYLLPSQRNVNPFSIHSDLFEFINKRSNCRISRLLEKMYYYEKYRMYAMSDVIRLSIISGKMLSIQTDINKPEQEVKTGRAVRKALGRFSSLIHDKEVEKFVNELVSEWDVKEEVQIAASIIEIYDSRHANKGSISGSCMKGDGYKMEIYESAGCDIAYIKDEQNTLQARALIWNKVKVAGIEGHVKFMDRLYISHPKYMPLFEKFAKDNSLYRGKNLENPNKEWICPNTGEMITARAKVKVDTDGFDYYPYIDTFRDGDSSSLNNYGEGIYTYGNTDGTREGDEDTRILCVDGELHDEENCIYLGNGRYQYRNAHIDDCVMDVDSQWWHKDDINRSIVEIGGEYYPYGHDDIMHDNYNGIWDITDNFVYSDIEDTYIHVDHAYLIETGEYQGQYCHEDNKEAYEGYGMEDETEEKEYINPNQLLIPFIIAYMVGECIYYL